MVRSNTRRELRILIIAITIFFFRVQKNDTVFAEIDFSRYVQEALTTYNNGEFFGAVKAYKKIADIGDIEGYINLAVIFKDLCDYARAINILNKAYIKFGDDLRILSLLGRLYYLNHQIDQAIITLQRILEIIPEDLEANINLGLCYAEKGDDIQAQNYYQKVILLSKNNVVARISLADLYYRKEKIPEAVEEYKKVSLIDASIVNIQKMLAELLLRLGRFEESLRIYQKIWLLEPQNKFAQERIAEISNRLGKGYFEKERERITLLRKQKRIFVKPFLLVKNIVWVRVGLMQGEKTIEFKCSTPFEIKTKSGQVNVLSGLEGKICLISRSADNKIIILTQEQEKIIVDEPILIKPIKPEGTTTLFNVTLGKNNFWISQSDRSYRGTMEVSVDKNGIKVINIVNLEEYLYSVLPSEMPAHWPAQALKAQTVAARSEAMKKLGRHKDEGFDFCPEVHCQAYTGVEQETEQTNRAVDETMGVVMFYQGKPIDALYSSNCGGHTQDNIFGEGVDIPYLRGRLDALENKGLNFPLSPMELEYWLKQPPNGTLCNTSEDSKNSNFRWVRIYSHEEIKELLNKMTDFGQIKKIVILKRNKSGHVTAIKIIGSNTAYVLKKEFAIRNALGSLRSSMFKIEIKYGSDNIPRQFIFYGGGFGHGVGMCQSGVYGLANLGRSYREILTHYYQGIEFKRIY